MTTRVGTNFPLGGVEGLHDLGHRDLADHLDGRRTDVPETVDLLHGRLAKPDR
ncbi:hypothetical protein [Saccharothrix algeriensis]|uniref:Uncharacterized protein n=1 Tax=Saccharothrix algeriensis TaxID=173560 RepID=A0A8T8I204_9PSEU|nr:hypothetical protein [Saccharothrix algeriensis]MBM7809712.1 hypothetical protein [Saccharothrix algeriensis]QTR04004.1 hypothetical protein J7S33_03045 [Saccharothrix algeriensis]